MHAWAGDSVMPSLNEPRELNIAPIEDDFRFPEARSRLAFPQLPELRNATQIFQLLHAH